MILIEKTRMQIGNEMKLIKQNWSQEVINVGDTK